MKVLIEFQEQRMAIMLPIELASDAAALIAKATVMKKDYRRDAPWEKAADRELVLSFISDESVLQNLSEREQALIAKADQQSTNWLGEYTKRTTADKRIAELEASLAAIQSVTVCQTVEPGAPAPAVSDDDVDF